MSWSIDVTGTREEVQAAVNTTVGCPDSVKGFVANACAYYEEETQLHFQSSGHAHNGLIATCNLALEAQPAPQPTQLPADTDEAEPK